MGAVAMWLRTQARSRWRAWVALAILAGVTGGAAMAAAAGARRSDSAYPRLLEWTRAPDLVTGGTSGGDDTFADEIAALEKHPLVAGSVREYTVSNDVLTADGRPLKFPGIAAGLIPPGVRNPYRAKLLRGRFPAPTRPDEGTVSFAAEGPGVALGDTLQVVLYDYSTDPPKTLLAPVRVVGIHAQALEFPSVAGVGFPGLNISPAFYTRYREWIPDDSSHLSLDIRLRKGTSFEEFTRDVSGRGIHVEFPIDFAEHATGVRRSMRFESGALWLLALLIGVAGVAIVGQAIGRQTYAEAESFSTLRALGMSASDFRGALVIRAAAVGVAAAGVAAVVATSLSPLTPIGLARIAEPEPGVRIDPAVLMIGAAAVVVLIVGAQLASAWRAVRRSLAPGPADAPSRLVSLLARAGAPTSAVAGVGMNVGGSRRSQVNAARSAAVATALGIGALVVALVFAASMSRLIDDPRLSGFTWDALLAGQVPVETLRSDPRVLSYSEGNVAAVEVGGAKTLALTVDEKGPIQPVVMEGRAPRGENEIVLGSAMMRRLHARIGSRVLVVRALDEGEPEDTPRATRTLTVTGRVVAPSFIFLSAEPGDTVGITMKAAHVLFAGTGFFEQDTYLVRLRPGTDLDRALAGENRVAPNAWVLPRQRSGDLQALSGIARLPLALAGIVAAIGAGALAHALAQTVRRRRRDLAILKSLGFVRHEVRSTVAWQTTSIVLAATIVALPIGVVLGRWGWRAFAEQLAVVPVPRVSMLAVLLLIPATIALGNLVGALPARSAARTRPALVLRAE